MTIAYSETNNPSQEISRINVLQDKVDSLNNLVATLTHENAFYQQERDNAKAIAENRRVTLSDLYEKIGVVERLCIEWVDDGTYFDECVFEKVAAIFEWETTKEIDVTVTSVFKGTITIPRGMDKDYLDEHFNVECNMDSEIDGYLDCDSIEVEVN